MTDASIDINNELDFTLQQMMAESYWGNYKSITDPDARKSAFVLICQYGNTRHNNDNSITPYQTPNSTKITQTQAEYLYNKYEIVDYKDNDASGFACLLLKDKTTGQFTLSMRSTEYKEDFFRDAKGADNSLDNTGFSVAQIAFMDNYYNQLKAKGTIPAGSVVNLSGYSLGSELSQALYLLHPNDFNHVYLENGPGMGEIDKDANGNIITTKSTTNGKTTLTFDATQYTTAFQSMIQEYKDIQNKNVFLSRLLGITDVNETLDTIGQFFPSTRISSTIDNTTQKLNRALYLTQPIAAGLASIYSEFKVQISSGLGIYTPDVYWDAITELCNPNYVGDMTKVADSGNIYEDPVEELQQEYLQKKYGTSSLAGLGTKIVDIYKGIDLGVSNDTLYPTNKFTELIGSANQSVAQTSPSDLQVVSNSNIHPDSNLLFINDQPQIQGALGRLPIFSTATSYLSGDFGNTHSITLIDDTLNVAKLVQTVDPTFGKTLFQINTLFNTSNEEFAKHWAIFASDSNTTDSRSLSNVVDSLYRIFVKPNANKIIRDNNTSTFSNLTEREALEGRMNAIKAVLAGQPNVVKQIVPLYNEDSNGNIVFLTPDQIATKAKQNNAEGMAYRYALTELNSFVVQGVDYSTDLNTNGKLTWGSRSNAWIDERAKMLDVIIRENYNNTGGYGSDKTYLDLSSTNNQLIVSTSISTQAAYNTNISNKINTLGPDYFTNALLAAQSYQISEGITGSTTPAQNGETIFDDNLTRNSSLDSNPSLPEVITYTSNNSSYSGTQYNDKFFLGNGNDTVDFSHNPLFTYLGINNLSNRGNDYDYVESGTGNNTFTLGSDSNVEMHVNGNTTINMKDTSQGSLYFDGTLLNGGTFNFTDMKYEQDKFTYEFVNNNGITNELKITDTTDPSHLKTVIINGFDRTQNQLGLGFTVAATAKNDKTTGLIASATNNIPYIATPTVYATRPAGQLDNGTPYNVNVGLSFTNSVFYIRGGNLFMYDKIAMKSYEIADYLGKVSSYTVNGSGNHIVGTSNKVDTVTFAGGTVKNISQLTPLDTPTNYSMNLAALSASQTYYFKDGDKITLDANLQFEGVSFKRSGNDLIAYQNTNATLASSAHSITLKNYFCFDNSVHSSFYAYNGTTTTELSVNDIKKYFQYEGDDSNDQIVLSGTTDYRAANAHQGDNKITGSSNDETFVDLQEAYSNSTAYGLQKQSTRKTVIDTGGGHDTIMIDFESGDTQILNYVPGDKILIKDLMGTITGSSLYLNHQLAKDGQDLLITSQDSTIRISSFFTNFTGSNLSSHGIYSANNLKQTQLDLSQFLASVNNLTQMKTFDGSLDQSTSTLHTQVRDSTGNDIVKGSKGGTDFSSTYGADTFTGNGGSNNLSKYTDVASGILTDTNYNPATDTVKLYANDGNTNVQVNGFQNGNDLTLTIADGNGVNEGGVTLEGWFTNPQVTGASSTSSTGITVTTSGGSQTLTYGSIGSLLQPMSFSGSNIDASTASRPTTITANGSTNTVHGSNFTDNISMQGQTTLYLSKGQDVYHLGLSSGVSKIMENGAYEHLLQDPGNHATIQLDANVVASDVKFYLDQVQNVFSIQVGNSSLMQIQIPQGVSWDDISSYYSLKTSTGTDLLASSYMVNYGNPNDPNSLYSMQLSDTLKAGTTAYNYMTGAGSNDLIIGGNGNDTIEATKGNNIILGGSGDDTIYGNIHNEDNRNQLILGGDGNDNISVGKGDIVQSGDGSGVDTISYQAGLDNFILALKNVSMANAAPLSTTMAFRFRSNGDDLDISTSTDDTDYTVIKDYFKNDNLNTQIANITVEQNHDTYLNQYGLRQVLENSNFTKSTISDGFHAVTYGQISSLLKLTAKNKLYGGSLDDYYNFNDNLTGYSNTDAHNVIAQFGTNPLIDKSLYKTSSPVDPLAIRRGFIIQNRHVENHM